jgi:hypothetical protein
MIYIFVIYFIVNGGFNAYQMYMTAKGYSGFMIDPLTLRHAELRRNRLITKGISFLEYPINAIMIYLGKQKSMRCFDFVPHICIITLCVKYYVEKEFALSAPGEYVFKSAIVTLRSCLLLAVFATNGMIDILVGLLCPTFIVLLAFKDTNFKKGELEIVLPTVIITLLGCFIFNYVVCEI